MAGVAVTLAKPDAMAPAVKAALAAGIPVVGLNAGFDTWNPLVCSSISVRTKPYRARPPANG